MLFRSVQLEGPFQIREERPRSSTSVVIVAAAAAVVPAEEAGCKEDAEFEEEVLVFELAEGQAVAVAAVAVVGIAAPSHREALSH